MATIPLAPRVRRGAIAGGRRPSRRLPALLVGACLALTLLPGSGVAHEAWFLSPEQIAALNAHDRPVLFTHLHAANVAMLAAAAAGMVGWLMLAGWAARHPAPGLLRRLAALERHTPLVVRLCFALTLAMAALGLHPRHGTPLLAVPSLAFPDLELPLLGAGWAWLVPLQLLLAAALLLGRGLRAVATAALLLTFLGGWLFGAAILPYAGAMAGAALFLLLAGQPDETLAGSPVRERALFLVRILTGATFLYCGVVYKLLQPNLALVIVEGSGMPTLGLPPEAFVLGMALVEIGAGALMITGVLIRPIVLVLFAAFLVLGGVLGESPLGHVLFYGNLFALMAGGPGRWGRVIARPSAAPRLAPGLAAGS
jgi:uncharacterized membrane protein YphA (DoxX/SURF4 family)